MLIKFVFFAIAPSENGISGGDRIFIELTREWSKKYRVDVYTTVDGLAMTKKRKLEGRYLNLISLSDKLSNSFLIRYLQKIFLGIRIGLSLKINKAESTILYSASEFWMDFFPALMCKIRYPQAKLICAWYQTAPNPIIGFKEKNSVHREKRYFLRAFAYWFSQLPVKPLIKKFADKVIVNNENEKKQFPGHSAKGKALVLIGAVPLDDIQKYKFANANLLEIKKYDAVFQGRFHPQKGVVELIDIWSKVVKKIPDAKLAMIGDGPLMIDVKQRIEMNKLKKNVKLFGYVFDGPKKYKIFAQSKIVLHPSFYDSGGMAAAEAMAFGIPCVGFDLVAYRSYYPKGMIKVELGDLDAYANAIVNLLRNNKLRLRVGSEAYSMIASDWDWKKRANNLLEEILR